MNHLKSTVALLMLPFGFLLHAGEFCVTTAAELRNALATAESNSAHDIIKIAERSYVTNGVAFSYHENQGWDLVISGGWTASSNNPCGQKIAGNPFDTILDGDNNNGVLDIELTGQADLVVSDIAFINGFAAQGHGGGLKVRHNNIVETGRVIVEKNIFINNQAENSSAFFLYGADEIVIRNNLIFANHVTNGVVISVIQPDGYGIYFTNNTVLLNTAESDSAISVYLSNFGSSKALVANNVLKDSLGIDLYLNGVGETYLKNNDLGILGGPISPYVSHSNINLPPRFEPGLLSFTPAKASPLVNAGTKPCHICPFPIPFDENWSLGVTDLNGYQRNQNGQVDLGAFESSHQRDLIFWGVFD